MSKDQEDSVEMDDLFEFLFDDGAWFRFPKDFLKIMGYGEALLLAFLCNHSNRVGSKKKKGWFWCRQSQVQEQLGISPRTQSNLLAVLKEKEFIECERHGVPPKRYFRIKHNNIWRALQKNRDESN